MASIHKEISINARPEDVWAAPCASNHVGAAWSAYPLLIYANGHGAEICPLSAFSPLPKKCPGERAISGQTTHHNASMQLFADGSDHSRLIRITDMLPNNLTASISKRVEQGAATIKQVLEEKALRDW